MSKYKTKRLQLNKKMIWFDKFNELTSVLKYIDMWKNNQKATDLLSFYVVDLNR